MAQPTPHQKEFLLPIGWAYGAALGLCMTGILILLIAFGAAAWTAATGVQQISLPGTQVLPIEKPGLYVGLYRHTEEGPIPAMQLSLVDYLFTNINTGERLPVQTLPQAQMFSMAGQEGAVLFQLDVPEKGEYLFNAEYQDAVKGPAVTAMLIHESVQSGRSDIVVGVLVFLIFQGLALYLFITTRKRAKAHRPFKAKPKHH